MVWMLCTGGPIGGCQLGGRTPYSLGYVQSNSKPHVADDATITLRYLGGTTCHRGTPQQAPRSMRINFFCDPVEVSLLFFPFFFFFLRVPSLLLLHV